ncbi:hypothetical protein PROVRETT_06799 [Providencia rettgeri DSM 1131]|nr:hypothetical protein PROVRETT_06799 [Providencia rettgeri DSM 1131]
MKLTLITLSFYSCFLAKSVSHSPILIIIVANLNYWRYINCVYLRAG